MVHELTLTFRICGVCDDHVKSPLVLTNVLQAVLDVNFDLWVVEAHCHVGQVFLAQINHSLEKEET